MGALDQFIADLLLTHGLNLLRLAADVRLKVLGLLTEMSKELTAKLQQEDISDFNQTRMKALLRESNVVIDNFYGLAQAQLTNTLLGLTTIEADYTAKVLTQAFKAQIGIGLPPTVYLEKLVGNTLIQGSASADWWKRQSADTQFKFANAVRQGAAQGETNAQIVARVVGKADTPGVMTASRRNAYALVQTSIQAVANAARLETFRKNADVVECLVWMATLDSHTCILCAERDLEQYSLADLEPLNGAPPAAGGPGVIHFSCRCAWTTKSKTFADLGLDIPEPKPASRASSGGQVDGDLSFKDWLAGKDAAFRKEYLGAGRAELYEAGKITLNDLMDQRGNPLTLAKLREKYGTDRSFQQPSGKFTIYDPGYARTVPNTSTPARAAAVKFEETVRRDSLETGAFFAPDGSMLLKRTGAPDRVTYTVGELQQMGGNIFSHNHPGGSTFSLADVKNAAFANVAELRAVAPDYRHILEPGGTWPAEAAIERAFNQALSRARIDVGTMIQRGELSEPYRTTEIYHSVWVEVAKKFSMIYTREAS